MSEISIQELKEQLKQGTFYYHKFGLMVKGKVKMVLELSKDSLNANFEGGTVDIYLDKIEKVKRPSNNIAEFEWCYKLKNKYDDEIGYIGFKKEEANG